MFTDPVIGQKVSDVGLRVRTDM